ncbi:MAG: rRNA adenine dimethyltransferase family protein, partial [Pseudomonadales bacterium]
TPLLFSLLEQHQSFAAAHSGALLFTDMHFMLQQEVVERICAAPGSKQFGRLSVMMQYFASVEALFGVPPEAFEPRPAVNSSILRVVPHRQLPFPAREPQRFAALVSAAFAQRRKTLRNNLKGICDAEQLESLGVDPGCRAESLAVQQFVAIANALSDI